MTLYITGIFLVLHWFYNNKPSVLPWAGLLLGVSVVSLIKNIPATFFVILFTLTELKKTRNWRGMVLFMLALIFPFVCFLVWASFKGVVVLMIQQVVFDAKQYIDTLRFPQNILNYYWPPNAALYGFDGRPITWVYELCLPLIAFAGMFTALLNLHSFGAKRRFVGWFTVACLVQWVSLLFVRSVFVQYFLPISWFLAVFTAYALNSVYEKIKTNRIYRHMVVAAGILILLGGLCVSWRANNKRASISYTAQAAYFEAQWRIIPDTAVVFPGTLFRLSIYPIGYGWHFV
ncbi:MAG: hypothetical protein NTY06_04375, partial [Candidatus Gottesmanbacteria bacterium]|nr:hypothetical protein [Candidatus Gottesmanbacteria bacterium]